MGDKSDGDAKFKNFRDRMERIKFYLLVGRHPPGRSKSQKTTLLNAVRNNKYKVDERGTLFYRAPNDIVWKKIIIDKEEKQIIVSSFHAPPDAAHSGLSTTTAKITRRFYWKGIKEDVKDYIRRCDVCQSRQGAQDIEPKLNKIRALKIFEPLYTVGMDLMGPLPETDDGYKYILILTDYFTKWVEFYPLKEKSGVCVADKIQSYIYRYGTPKKLLSDQDLEFLNHVNAALEEKFDIARMITPAYHPQANGLDERTDHTLKARLIKLSREKQKDWDAHLDVVAFSLRVQKQPLTNFSPFFLMYNREPRLPMEMETACQEDMEDMETNAMPKQVVEEYHTDFEPKIDIVKLEALLP